MRLKVSLTIFLAIVITLSFLQEIQRRQKLVDGQETSVSVVVPLVSPDCEVETRYYYFKLDHCSDYLSPGKMQVFGRVVIPTDDRLFSKKRLIVSEIHAIQLNPYSVKDWREYLQAFTSIIRQQAIELIRAKIPPLEAGVLVAIVFGTTDFVHSDIKPLFKTTGTLHLLAASGLNVSIVQQFILSLLPRSLISSLKGLILVVALLAYLLLVGFQPSIVRAVLMGFQKVVARYWVFRQYHSLYALAVSALIMLLIYPEWLLAIGFQLSVSATAGIIVITPYLLHFLKLSNLDNDRDSLLIDSIERKTIRQRMTEPFLLGISAQTATLPLVIYHFQTIPGVTFIPAAVLGIFMPTVLQFGLAGLAVISVSSAFPSQLLGFDQFISYPIWIVMDLFLFVLQSFAIFDWFQLDVSNSWMRYE